MLLLIPGVLKADELELRRRAAFGRPGGAARQEQPGARGRRAGALPLHVASPLYARYRPGMAYGDHLDDPIMGSDGVMYRSDVAVTFFSMRPKSTMAASW